MAKSQKLILGVDIGGTKIASGLITPAGKIILNLRVPMVANRTAEAGLLAVRGAIENVLQVSNSKEIRAIGVSVPGWIDSRSGEVLSAANLPCWRNFPLARRIRQHFRLPVKIANDAKAAALAEATWGAGRGYRNVFYVTLGTGVGTGVVVDGRIYEGIRGPAGEGGHISIDFRGPRCPCGKFGCAEMYISGPAIARNARERLERKSARHSQLLKLVQGNLASVRAEHVVEAAAKRDALARQVLADFAEHAAIWLGTIIDLLEPEMIVIGGGLSGVLMDLLPQIRRHLKRWSCSPSSRQTKIVKALYGTNSALAGAAALHFSAAE